MTQLLKQAVENIKQQQVIDRLADNDREWTLTVSATRRVYDRISWTTTKAELLEWAVEQELIPASTDMSKITPQQIDVLLEQRKRECLADWTDGTWHDDDCFGYDGSEWDLCKDADEQEWEEE